jgi:hypothetical protein
MTVLETPAENLYPQGLPPDEYEYPGFEPQEPVPPGAYDGNRPHSYDRYSSQPFALPPEFVGENPNDDFNTVLVPWLWKDFAQYWEQQYTRVERARHKEGYGHMEDTMRRAFISDVAVARAVVDPVEAALQKEDAEAVVLWDLDKTTLLKSEFSQEPISLPPGAEHLAKKPRTELTPAEMKIVDTAIMMRDLRASVTRPAAFVVPAFLKDKYPGSVHVGTLTSNPQGFVDAYLKYVLNQRAPGLYDTEYMLTYNKDSRLARRMSAEFKSIWVDLGKDTATQQTPVTLRELLDPARSPAYQHADDFVDFNHRLARQVHARDLASAIMLHLSAEDPYRFVRPLTIFHVDDTPVAVKVPVPGDDNPRIREIWLDKIARFYLPENMLF